MKGKAEKASGARVRASRARSRVEARKKAGAKSREPQRGRGSARAAASLAGGAGAEPQKEKARRPRRRKAVGEPRGEVRTEAGMEEPRAGRKSRRRARPARTLVLGALLVVSLASLLWVYTGTGVLNVKKVEVRGNEILEEGYLRSLSGINPSTHLIRMDVKTVEEALLSEPYIARVDISRRFPDTVVLDVSERHPSGAIVQNGKYALVDQEGVVLESVDVPPPGAVEIRDMQLPLLLPGTRISGMDFASVTSLLGSLPPALREQTAAVGLRGDEGLYLEAGGTLVIYGEPRDLTRKNSIALVAVTVLVKRYASVEYVDITFPDHPVIKPAGAV